MIKWKNSKHHGKDLSKGTQVHLLNKVIFRPNLIKTVQTGRKGREKSTGGRVVIGFTLKKKKKTALLLNHQSFFTDHRLFFCSPLFLVCNIDIIFIQHSRLPRSVQEMLFIRTWVPDI